MTVRELNDSFSGWRLSRERIVNLCIGVSAILVYEFFARPLYRPYIYRNNINDFHVADTIGNSLGTLATIFVFIGIIGKGRTQHLALIKLITLSVVLYELVHPLLGKKIDPWDILATVITGAASLAVYRILHPVAQTQDVSRNL